MSATTNDDDLSEPHVLGLVNHYLSLHVYSTATFLCERLYAQSKVPHILHKLASCYYASGDIEKTFMLLRGSTSPDNRYLYAVCAEKLGNLQEVERSLLSGSNSSLASLLARHDKELGHLKLKSSRSNEHIISTRQFVRDIMNVPNGAAGLFLLGTACRKGNRKQQAQRCFDLCLQLEPFFWGAYEALSDMGFQGHEEIFYKASMTLPLQQQHQHREASQAADPAAYQEDESARENSLAPAAMITTTTPSNFSSSSSSSSTTSSSSSTTSSSSSSSTTDQTMYVTPGGVSEPPRTPSNGNSTITGIPTPRNTAGRPRAHPAARVSSMMESNDHPKSDRSLLRLLHLLGKAYYLSCQYECREALALFGNLSSRDYNSGWVLHQVAKCYFEIPNYKKAEAVFKHLRSLEPYRMKIYIFFFLMFLYCAISILALITNHFITTYFTFDFFFPLSLSLSLVSQVPMAWNYIQRHCGI